MVLFLSRTSLGVTVPMEEQHAKCCPSRSLLITDMPLRAKSHYWKCVMWPIVIYLFSLNSAPEGA